MATLQVTNLNDIPLELVTQTQAEITQLIQERHPEVEVLTRGVIHDLICYFGAVFGAWSQTELQRYLNARSLLQIANDPALADTTLADDVFSMFNVTRQSGTYAAGEVVIVVLSDAPVVLAAGTAFTANGLTFVTLQAYDANVAGSQLITADTRIMNPLGNGTYAFTVPVQCSVTGAEGNVARSTKMTPTTDLAGFVTAYAAGDFDGGTVTEDNAAMLRRLQDGIAAKTISGSANIRALIKEQAAFTDTLEYSVIGFGNPEMTRDQHSLFPISCGGRIDVYARTRELPLAIALTKEATLVGTVATGGIWQFTINRDEAPGFYEIVQIRREDDDPDVPSLEILSDQRFLDLSVGQTLVPDIISVGEGAYSRYQTAVVQFVDPATSTDSTPIGSVADYIVSASGMPQIADLQDFLGGTDVRYRAGDILVRAAVPCFLSVNFQVRIAKETTAPDTAAMKNALATAVNQLGFPSQVHASLLADVAHNYLSGRQALGIIDMQGRIRRPSGEMHYIHGTTLLQIPEDPLNYVTGRTTVFFLDPQDIAIDVITEGFTDDL
jgi:hypothetical protein